MVQFRILFMADTHLGFDLPLRPRIARRRRGHDLFANYDRILQAARTHRVDAVIHGGDLFYRSRVPSQLVDKVFAPLKTMAAAGIPVFIVPGNHERSRIPHSERTLHPKLHVFMRPATFTLPRGRHRLAIAGFPFLGENIRDRFKALVAATGWRRTTADAALLCLHQSIEGACVGPADYRFGCSPDVIRGQDIPAGFTAVLAGHIHRHQVLTQDLRDRLLPAPVFYPGSIERISFAEQGEPKGYLLLTIDGEPGPGHRQIHGVFQPLPARPMITLSLWPNRMTPIALHRFLAHRLEDLPRDAIVRLKLMGPVPDSHRKLLGADALRRLAPDTMNLHTTWMEKKPLVAANRQNRRTERFRFVQRDATLGPLLPGFQHTSAPTPGRPSVGCPVSVWARLRHANLEMRTNAMTAQTPLQPLPSHRYAAIVEHIEAHIAKGSLAPGDRLPSERQLAATLKVSRSSVREGLRVLDQRGLLEIRRGRRGGAYLRQPSHRQTTAEMEMLLHFDRLTLDQINDFRLAIEGYVTALAARSAGPADIRQLHRRLERVRAGIKRGAAWIDTYIEADKAVHLYVAQMAGNPLFSQAIEAAMGLKPYYCRFLRLHPALMETNYLDLVEIVRAVETHQPDLASGAIAHHITRFNAAVS
jgi:DNA-binding FadR family transcriptional regulator/DNA repair exonuclease SbcCD nuclease subunit